MSPFAAALAATVAELADGEVEGRKRNAKRLAELLTEVAEEAHLEIPRPLSGGEPGYLRFPVLFRNGLSSSIGMAGGRRLGIAEGYPKPLPDLPVMSKLNLEPGWTFPGAQQLSRSLITLPSHSLVNGSDRARICRFLRGTP